MVNPQSVEDLASSKGFDERLSGLIKNLSWVREGDLEKGSRALYWVLLPILYLICLYCAIKYYLYLVIFKPKDKVRKLLGPKRGLIFFDRAHWLLEKTRNGVTSWRALAAIYSAPLEIDNKYDLRSRIARFWFFQPEAMAVRNRLLLVHKGIFDYLVRLYWKKYREINILSLACGSAQAVIEACAFFHQQYPEIRVNITLVDIDTESLEMAKSFADYRGISVTTVNEKVKNFLEAQPAGKWDIIEEAGFLDYRGTNSFIVNCAGSFRALAPGGLFLAAQIGHSPWSLVTRWITGWPLLIRRSNRRYRHMLEMSEIPRECIDVVTEPQGIYHISFVRRYN